MHVQQQQQQQQPQQPQQQQQFPKSHTCVCTSPGFIANPILLHAYFATIGVLEGRSPQEILALTKEQFHQVIS